MVLWSCARAEGNIQEIEPGDVGSDLGSAVYSQCHWRNPFITLSFTFLILKIKPERKMRNMRMKTTNTVCISRMTGKCLIKKKVAPGEGEVEIDGMQTQERSLAMRTDQTESRCMVGGCYWNQ